MPDKALRTIYQSAYNFLLQQEGITEPILKKHLVSISDKPNDLKIIYERFCESAQNRQMSSTVIGKSIGGTQNLSKVLYKFDPHKVAEKYQKTDNMVLLKEIIHILKPKGKIRKTPRSIWPQFCKTVIDAAHFLKQFKTAKEFYKWADFFANDHRAKPALPLMIGTEIRGFGFPLACDTLKELGYEEYGKPDIHLKDIFKALNLIDPSANQDYETLKAIDRIAKANKTTAYAVDKVFWLIGSSNFYMTGHKIGRKKKEFIGLMKKKLEV